MPIFTLDMPYKACPFRARIKGNGMRFGRWAVAAAAMACATQAGAARYYTFELKGQAATYAPTSGNPSGSYAPVLYNDDLTLSIDTVANPTNVLFGGLGRYTVDVTDGVLSSQNRGGFTFILNFDPATVPSSSGAIMTSGSYTYVACSSSCAGPTPATLLSVTGFSSDVAPAVLGVTDRLTATPLPEPSIWLTLIAGFGAIGASLRTRRRRQPALIGAMIGNTGMAVRPSA